MDAKFDKAISMSLEVLEAIEEARPGTTVQQAQVFMAIVELGGDADRAPTQEEIGDRLRRPQGPISKVIKKLVDAGLLQKEFAPGSELNKQYPLTPKGRGLLLKIRNIVNRG